MPKRTPDGFACEVERPLPASKRSESQPWSSTYSQLVSAAHWPRHELSEPTHGWSPALPADRLPSLPSALRLAPQTNYSAWATYEAQAAEAGLVRNATLQQALHGLTPAQMAEGDAAWPQRNFEALFTRAAHDTVVR